MKKIIFALLLLVLIQNQVKSQNDFSIIPENQTDVSSYVDKVGKSGGKVMEAYKNIAYGERNPDGSRKGGDIKDLGGQLSSGIMTWDTLLDYVTYIVRFLLQIGLLVGAIVMIYIGYKKITEFRDFKGGAIKYVIIGIVVISFAYVIIKTVVSMFIE